jgi:hypothetical protein
MGLDLVKDGAVLSEQDQAVVRRTPDQNALDGLMTRIGHEYAGLKAGVSGPS